MFTSIIWSQSCTLPRLSGERHETGVVDDHVHAAVDLYGMINERFDLITAGDIGLHDGVMAERRLPSEDLEPVGATRPRTSLAPCRASSRAVASPQ